MVGPSTSQNDDTSTSPSEIPFVKAFPFRYGVPDRLSERIIRVIANNPGPFTFTGSGTYLITNQDGSGPCAVIDPGPHDEAHIQALLDACPPEGISHILITHTHNDHCGGARLLQQAAQERFSTLGAPPLLGFGEHPVADPQEDGPALEEGADYDFHPDIQITDDETVTGESWTLRAVHTPGHLSNHLCFALDEENALFTGDHMMGWATTVIIPPDGHMGDYFASLERLLERDDRCYYPTHGAPIEEPHGFVRAVRTHRRMRDRQILNCLERGQHTIQDMVETMYRDVDPRLHVAAALNVLAHLIHLHEQGRVVAEPSPGLKAYYTLIKDRL